MRKPPPRLVAVAVDVPDDDARGLDRGSDGRDVGVVRPVVADPGGRVQPGGLVGQVPAEAPGQRDRHRGGDLGGPGIGRPPAAFELAGGLLDERVPVVPRDGDPPRKRAAAAPGGLRGDDPPAPLLAGGRRLSAGRIGELARRDGVGDAERAGQLAGGLLAVPVLRHDVPVRWRVPTLAATLVMRQPEKRVEVLV